MSWRDWFWLGESRQNVSGLYDNWGTTTNPSVSLITYLNGGKTAAGVEVNEQTAEGIPAIYACVHVISETIGQLPLKLFRLSANGKNKDPDTEHPLYLILHDRANPEMSSYQFREMQTRHLAIWGRAYAYIQRNGRGDVIGLWPLHPSRMFVERDGLNRKVFKYWMGRGDYQEWVHNPERPDIMHLHVNSDDGLDGRSPLKINRESLGITLAAEQYTGGWFGNGAIPGMVLTHPGRLKEGAKENLRKQWLEKFMGASKSNKLAILEEGITLEVVGVDPEKSQLDKLRAAQIEAAARIYRVPLFMIQNQTKDTSWGSGIEQQMLGFVNTTLMPWIVQWEQAIKWDLLTRQSYYTHEPAFNVNALIRGDVKARMEAYTSARENGWMNGDEIRELEDLNPIPDGSGAKYWQPTYMMPIVNGLPVPADANPSTPAPTDTPQIDQAPAAPGSNSVN